MSKTILNENFDIPKLFTRVGGKTITSEDLINVISNKSKYIKRHRIPKKTKGEFRYIIEPLGVYKDILQGILQNVLHRFYKADDAAFGCVPHKSNKDGAIPHIGAKKMFHTDISNCFDNLHDVLLRKSLCGNDKLCSQCKLRFDMLKGKCAPKLSTKCSEFAHDGNRSRKDGDPLIDLGGKIEEYHNPVALINWIIELCTVYDKKKGVRYTPQGFPTSPALLNISLRTWFDRKLSAYCIDKSLAYTRYVDDIVISSTNKDLDHGVLKDARKYTLDLIYSLNSGLGSRILMRPNYRKTWIKSSKKRMEVFGVVVHEKTSIRKYKILNLRAAVHQWEIKTGLRKDLAPKARSKMPNKVFMRLRGLATYYSYINPNVGKLLGRLNEIPVRY